MSAGPVTITAEHQPVMGTHLALQITAADEDRAHRAEAAIVDDARRLEACFTVFDRASELCRWRAAEVDEAGPDLTALLALAARWQERSEGAFNPMAGVLTRRWLQAVIDGVPPAPSELASLAASIAQPRFEVADGVVRRTGSCAELDLNAIAKGHVVDLVARRAMADGGLDRLVINAGGDLVHRGLGTLRVAVEDPLGGADNRPPLVRIEVADAAVATSGRSRRWFDVGGQRWSRVLDPRTGLPVDRTASATVVAPDAATADVVATVASVLAPHAACAFVDDLSDEAGGAPGGAGEAGGAPCGAGGAGGPVACLVVAASGEQHRSAAWPALER